MAATTTTAPRAALVDDAGIAVGSGLAQLPVALVDLAFAEVARSGAGWARIDVDWSGVEPVRGQFRWDEIDRVEAAARQAGVRVLAVLAYTPAWARPAGTTDKMPPTDPADFARFAGAVADRYASNASAFRAWEIWNEPNVSTFWRPRPDPTAYARLLAAASSAIRAADADAVVVTGGVAPGVDAPDGSEWAPESFVRAMLAAGAAGSFDALGAHPYSYPARPDDESTADWNSFVRLPLLRAALARAGRADAPLWLTEVGAPTGTDARAVVRSGPSRDPGGGGGRRPGPALRRALLRLQPSGPRPTARVCSRRTSGCSGPTAVRSRRGTRSGAPSAPAR